MDFMNEQVRAESRALSDWLKNKEVAPDIMNRCGLSVTKTNCEFRAMASADSPAVSSAFYAAFVETLDNFSPMRRVANVIGTDNGEPLMVPTVDDTDETGGLIDENDDLAADDILIGKLTLGSYRYGSGVLRVSRELLDDATPATMAMLGKALAKRAARTSNVAFTTGSGTNQPEGIVTGSTLGKTAAADDAITFADVLDLQHSLDESYWPTASWMMNKATFKIVRQLVDANDIPAFQGNLLLGSSVILNPSMPSVGSGAKPILYGDFSQYIVRETPLDLRRHFEAYAEFAQIGLAANVRCDGRLSVPTSVRHLVMATS